MKIVDIPVYERPREKLINNGVVNLSNEELLSIIINTGYKSKSAKELASLVLSLVEDTSKLDSLTINKIMSIKGIGLKKASTLIACFELGKRINYKGNKVTNTKFINASTIYEYYRYLKEEYQEKFFVIYLDTNKRIIKEKLLFVGTLNYSVVHPREVFKEAYLNSASSLICIHNHPTGEIIPSSEDINLTNRLKETGLLLGIKVIDHIIIGNGYYSFFENNLI